MYPFSTSFKPNYFARSNEYPPVDYDAQEKQLQYAVGVPEAYPICPYPHESQVVAQARTKSRPIDGRERSATERQLQTLEIYHRCAPTRHRDRRDSSRANTYMLKYTKPLPHAKLN